MNFDSITNAAQKVQHGLENAVNSIIGPVTCIDVLAEQKGVLIKQKIEIFEALTGCETPNIYKVHATNEEGKKIKKKKALFKCKEKSSTCARICLPGSTRPFEMKVNNYGCKDFQDAIAKQIAKANDDSKVAFKLSRKYQCTFLCCNRPVLEVNHTEGDQVRKIGSIMNPWYFCNYGCHVRDAQDNIRYKLEASCCQCYFWFALPCKSCNKVEFKVFDASGEHVTSMWKEGKGCLANMLTDADNFRIVFPTKATKEDKVLLFCSMLMLDYMYFEDKQTQGGQGGVHPA